MQARMQILETGFVFFNPIYDHKRCVHNFDARISKKMCINENVRNALSLYVVFWVKLQVLFRLKRVRQTNHEVVGEPDQQWSKQRYVKETGHL